jgi:hypothetical protein
MFCQPRLLIDLPVRRPKISVILLDWGVRESFHALHYLNNQTVPREDYELIWIEFYNREPTALWDMVRQSGHGRPGVDRWLVLGYPDDLIYHKHRLYNLGLLAARGDVCVICDSDAIFMPGFIERIIREFEQTPHGTIHLDQVRSLSRDYYPFNYPEIDDVTRTSNNWMGMSTKGMLTLEDRLHNVNMGACLAARRQDLLAIGGADEHLDYLGYICGPYDMTFRLVNYHGVAERWLFDEFLYHTWHPNTTGGNEDYQGPHDGRSMSLLARRSLHVVAGAACTGDAPGAAIPAQSTTALVLGHPSAASEVDAKLPRDMRRTQLAALASARAVGARVLGDARPAGLQPLLSLWRVVCPTGGGGTLLSPSAPAARLPGSAQFG